LIYKANVFIRLSLRGLAAGELSQGYRSFVTKVRQEVLLAYEMYQTNRPR